MTYILGTNKISNKKYFKDENGCDICEKITYLGIYNMIFIESQTYTTQREQYSQNRGKKKRGILLFSFGFIYFMIQQKVNK